MWACFKGHGGQTPIKKEIITQQNFVFNKLRFFNEAYGLQYILLY